jgi:hypothetical protein
MAGRGRNAVAATYSQPTNLRKSCRKAVVTFTKNGKLNTSYPGTYQVQ